MAGQVLLGWPSFLTSEPFLRGRKRIDGWRQPNTVIVNPLLALSSHDYICAMARILLIDDDPALLMDLLALIEQVAPAIAADTAPTAEQALRLIQWTEYNAIVSDFNMHGLNGMDFFKECKTARPDIPVVMLTGYGTHALEAKVLKEGAYAVVQKPVVPQVFLSVVTRAVIRREVDQAGSNVLSSERQRLLSRLKQIDEHLKKQIDDSKKGQYET